jgi:apolipoprotein N-acyltransferase
VYHALPLAVFGYCASLFQWTGKTLGGFRNAAAFTVIQLLFPQLLRANHAHALFSTPLAIQILDIGGVPILLFSVALVNMVLVDLILCIKDKRSVVPATLTLVITMGMIAGYGQYRLNVFHEELSSAPTERIVRIGSVQPNIPDPRNRTIENGPAQTHIPASKWKGPRTNLLVDEGLNTIFEMSRGLVRSHRNLDLIVWPEIPVVVECNREAPTQQKIKAVSEELQKPLLVTCVRHGEKGGGKDYNGALFVHRSDKTAPPYRRMILFPFAEYLPYEKEFPWLRRLFPNVQNFVPGREPVIYNLDGSKRVIPALCYELTFSDHFRPFIKGGGNVIVNMVDDMWFGRTDASIGHYALGIFRAVEYRLPIVRVTNTGIGVFVQPTGEIVPGSRTPLFEKAAMSYSLLIPENQQTVYFYVDDLFLWILTAWFCLDVLFLVSMRRRLMDTDMTRGFKKCFEISFRGGRR